MDLLSLGRHMNQLDNNISYHIDGDVLRFSASIGPQVKVHGEFRPSQGEVSQGYFPHAQWGGWELCVPVDGNLSPEKVAKSLLSQMAPNYLSDSRSQYMVQMQRALVALGFSCRIEGDQMHVRGSYLGEDWSRILVWASPSAWRGPIGYIRSLYSGMFIEDFRGSPAQAAQGVSDVMQKEIKEVQSYKNMDPEARNSYDLYRR